MISDFLAQNLDLWHSDSVQAFVSFGKHIVKIEMQSSVQTVTVQCLSLMSQGPVRGMSLRKVISLGSNLVLVTGLKRIQTPHSLCCDFGGYKTLQLVG